jgi:hypothetical protein
MGKGFLMCDEIHEWINNNIPKGSVILELGSGKGTQRLTDAGYTMYSIEHDKGKWFGRYESTYIYAPIDYSIPWYNPKAIKKQLPEHYDVLLIDGPPRKVGKVKVGRRGLSQYLDMFNTDVTMIFDDSDRGRESNLINDVKEIVKRDYTVYKGRDHRGKGTYFAVFDKVENG